MMNQLNQLHELYSYWILSEGILIRYITCCNSGNDINSSTDSDPELSRSSFLNRFPSRLISSASKLVAISIGKLASFPILFVFSLMSSQQSTGKIARNDTPQELCNDESCDSEMALQRRIWLYTWYLSLQRLQVTIKTRGYIY